MATARNPAAKITAASSLLIGSVAALILALSKSGLIGNPPEQAVKMTELIEAATAAGRESARDEMRDYFKAIDIQLQSISKAVANVPNMEYQIHDLENRVEDMVKKPSGRIWEAIEELRARLEAMKKAGVN